MTASNKELDEEKAAQEIPISVRRFASDIDVSRLVVSMLSVSEPGCNVSGMSGQCSED